jgi:hypothetical protein
MEDYTDRHGTIRWDDYLYDLVEEGSIHRRDLVIMVAKYLTREDIYGMLDANELTPRFREEECTTE